MNSKLKSSEFEVQTKQQKSRLAIRDVGNFVIWFITNVDNVCVVSFNFIVDFSDSFDYVRTGQITFTSSQFNVRLTVNRTYVEVFDRLNVAHNRTP